MYASFQKKPVKRKLHADSSKKEPVIQAVWKPAYMLEDTWAYPKEALGKKEKGRFVSKDLRVVVAVNPSLPKWALDENWMWILLPEGVFCIPKETFSVFKEQTPFGDLFEMLEWAWVNKKELLRDKSQMKLKIYREFTGTYHFHQMPLLDFLIDLNEVVKMKPENVRVSPQGKPEQELQDDFYLEGARESWGKKIIHFSRIGIEKKGLVINFDAPEQSRMSLHPLPEYVVKVFRFLFKEIFMTDEFPTIRKMKISDFSSLRSRTDTIIVYIDDKASMHKLCMVVEKYVREHLDYFPEEVYRTTLPIARGVSISDMPIVTHGGIRECWTRVPTALLSEYLEKIERAKYEESFAFPLTESQHATFTQFEEDKKECYQKVAQEPEAVERLFSNMICQMVFEVFRRTGKALHHEMFAMKDASIVDFLPGELQLMSKDTREISYGMLRSALIADALLLEHESFRAFYRIARDLFIKARINFQHPYKSLTEEEFKEASD